MWDDKTSDGQKWDGETSDGHVAKYTSGTLTPIIDQTGLHSVPMSDLLYCTKDCLPQEWWKTEVVPQPFAFAIALLCGWGPTSSTHLIFILLYSHLFQEISPLGMSHSLGCQRDQRCVSGNCFSSLKLRAATHWGTLKSGGLSESERHLVGPIVHIEVTNATTYTCTLEVPSPSVKN